MKWIFILLLLANVVYLGLEIDKDLQLKRANIANLIKIPAGTPQLQLLSEMEVLPDRRDDQMRPDGHHSAKSFGSEPILPISLKPRNTQNILNTLANDSPEARLGKYLGSGKNNLGINEIDQNKKELDNTRCYTYGPIPNLKEAKLFSDWLNERKINYKKRITNEEGKPLFRVYLAPKKSYARAEAILKDLKKKGVKDLHLIKEGDLLNAISLGLFSGQASTNRRLKEIKAKGYHALAMPYEGNKGLRWFDIYVEQNLNYIRDLFIGFPGRFNVVPVRCSKIAMQ